MSFRGCITDNKRGVFLVFTHPYKSEKKMVPEFCQGGGFTPLPDAFEPKVIFFEN